ncbi:MAG: restriction endonuclease subunit S, partial [Planktothrix sp.]
MSEWKETTLGEIVNLKTGKLNSNAAVNNGKYPFFTCS